MPRPQPIPRSRREAVAEEIRAGRGRNELARAFGISPGSVTNIARDYGLWFEGSAQTATETRQIDLWAARVDKAAELDEQLYQLPTTMKPNGKPTRAWKRLSYAIYNLNRHHDGTYRA